MRNWNFGHYGLVAGHKLNWNFRFLRLESKIKLKAKFYRMTTRLLMLYGSKCWAVKKLVRKIDVCENENVEMEWQYIKR